jgi:hypothetical protein
MHEIVQEIKRIGGEKESSLEKQKENKRLAGNSSSEELS